MKILVMVAVVETYFWMKILPRKKGKSASCSISTLTKCFCQFHKSDASFEPINRASSIYNIEDTFKCHECHFIVYSKTVIWLITVNSSRYSSYD